MKLVIRRTFKILITNAKNVVFLKCINKKLIFPIEFRPSTFDPRPRLLTLDLDFRTSTYDPRPSTYDPRRMTLDPRPLPKLQKLDSLTKNVAVILYFLYCHIFYNVNVNY
jgi:hypothetical protein